MLSLLTTTAACRGSRCGRGRRGGRGGRPDRPRRGAAARPVHPRRRPRGSRQEVPALPEDEESPQQPGGRELQERRGLDIRAHPVRGGPRLRRRRGRRRSPMRPRERIIGIGIGIGILTEKTGYNPTITPYHDQPLYSLQCHDLTF